MEKFPTEGHISRATDFILWMLLSDNVKQVNSRVVGLYAKGMDLADYNPASQSQHAAGSLIMSRLGVLQKIEEAHDMHKFCEELGRGWLVETMIAGNDNPLGIELPSTDKVLEMVYR